MESLSSISPLDTISKHDQTEGQAKKPKFNSTPSIRSGTIEEALASNSLKEMSEYADGIMIQMIDEAGFTKENVEEIQKGMNESFDDNDAHSVGSIAYWILHTESSETKKIWFETLNAIAEHNKVKINFQLLTE